MTFRRAIAIATATAFFGVLGATSACKSDDTSPACDDSKCKTGNKCLPLAGEIKCRKTCSSNSDPTTSCPAGYTCVQQDDTSIEPFCVQDNYTIATKPGQWGAQCNPAEHTDNPSCDKSQDFYCFATSPTDGDAYCTRFSCAADNDCAAGFWCATVNVGPSADTTKRTYQQTQTVCRKREYCATCKFDLDCLPLAGRPQHCVQDANGAGFCTPECSATSNCNNEAHCVDYYQDGSPKVCYPRANVCVGDGSLCSPCRSDADCGPDGICGKGEYTTERACATKAKSDCGSGNGGCPASISSPKVSVTCVGSGDNGYCSGTYKIGGQPADLGCYTPNR